MVLIFVLGLDTVDVELQAAIVDGIKSYLDSDGSPYLAYNCVVNECCSNKWKEELNKVVMSYEKKKEKLDNLQLGSL